MDQIDQKFAGLDQRTINQFLVGARGENVVIQNPPRGPMTRDEALRLAIWLVCIADDKFGHEGGRFDAMMKTIRNS